MRTPSVSSTLATLLLASNFQNIIAHPQPISDSQLVDARDTEAISARDDFFADGNALVKRKGGGGGGGKGGGGGSSSSSSSGGSGSSSGASGAGGRGSAGSNAGGSTRTGSGAPPSYGGGRYYGGGATVPYAAGTRSYTAGILPVFFLSTALTFWATAWIYGAYSYPYNNPYTFRNRTAVANSTTNNNTPARSIVTRISSTLLEARQTTTEGVNQTKPVICFCAQYSVCGCDEDGSTTFLDSVIGDGTYANLNQSVIQVADVNGTSTILLNGTLPNGTTAPGGTEDAFDSGVARGIQEMGGYWVMIAIVAGMVYFV